MRNTNFPISSEKIPQDNSNLAWLAFAAGSFFLIMAVTILIFSAIFRLLGLSAGSWPLLLGLAGSIVWLFIIIRNNRQRLWLVLGLLLLTITATLVATFFYDLSYDGQLYHQEMIGHLAAGWNPVLQPFTYDDMCLRYYPKGGETLAASVYLFLGRMQPAKVFNFLFSAASLFVAYAACLGFPSLPKRKAQLLALLLAANPISVCSSLSFYIDGQLASIILCTLALLVLFLIQRRGIILAPLAASLVILINLKFNGLAYAAILGLSLAAAVWRLGKPWRWKVLLALIVIALGGIALVGFNPYCTNTWFKGHPFFPFYGKNSLSYYWVHHQPADFQGLSRLEKLGRSFFARSAVVRYPYRSRPKYPLTVDIDEIKQFGDAGPEVRVGGFGPLFSGLFLISLGGFVFLARRAGRSAIPYFVAILVVLISILANPEGWWARFAPQLWIVPFIPLLFLHFRPERVASFGCRLILFLLLLNTMMVGLSFFGQRTAAAIDFRQHLTLLERISRSGRWDIHVDFGIFHSARLWFKERGIAYQEMDFQPTNTVLTHIGQSQVNYYLTKKRKTSKTSP